MRSTEEEPANTAEEASEIQVTGDQMLIRREWQGWGVFGVEVRRA